MKLKVRGREGRLRFSRRPAARRRRTHGAQTGQQAAASGWGPRPMVAAPGRALAPGWLPPSTPRTDPWQAHLRAMPQLRPPGMRRMPAAPAAARTAAPSTLQWLRLPPPPPGPRSWTATRPSWQRACCSVPTPLQLVDPVERCVPTSCLPVLHFSCSILTHCIVPTCQLLNTIARKWTAELLPLVCQDRALRQGWGSWADTLYLITSRGCEAQVRFVGDPEDDVSDAGSGVTDSSLGSVQDPYVASEVRPCTPPPLSQPPPAAQHWYSEALPAPALPAIAAPGAKPASRCPVVMSHLRCCRQMPQGSCNRLR